MPQQYLHINYIHIKIININNMLIKWIKQQNVSSLMLSKLFYYFFWEETLSIWERNQLHVHVAVQYISVPGRKPSGLPFSKG